MVAVVIAMQQMWKGLPNMCAIDWVKLLVDGVEWLWSVQMARWQIAN